MTRPSLTPLTYHEFDRPTVSRIRRLHNGLCRAAAGSLRWSGRTLVGAFTVDLTSERWRRTLPARSVVLSMAMKTAWAAPAIVGACAWVVHQETHVPRHAAHDAQVSRVQGAYSERITFPSGDGLALSAVWVPAVTARDVIERADKVLAERRPAVLLVHDHARDADQMLAHVSALHAMGVHVLAVDTRGRGQSGEAALTFGQLERLDVAAAVDYLAVRPTVDGQRIAVWAVGSAARAAEMAPTAVPIALLINQPAEPLQTPGRDAVVDTRFLPSHPMYDPLRPVCRWTFSLMYAGGPAVDPPHQARRTVSVPADDPQQAMAALREFANDRLMASTQ